LAAALRGDDRLPPTQLTAALIADTAP